MIINYVFLNNIRSYESKKIEFSCGKLLLVGDVGAGKSTILLAIEFALFGIIKGSLSGETLLRKGEKEAFVEVSITVDKKTYIIRRYLKKNKKDISQKNGYIISDSMKHEMTPNELKAKVFEILGYPLKMVSKSKSILYRYTVYTPQEMMKDILFQNDDERIDAIRRIFQLDKYKRIINNASVAYKSLREKRIAIEGSYFDLDMKKKEKDVLSERINDEEKEHERLKDECNIMIKSFEEIRKKKSRLDDLKNKKSSIQHAIEISENSLKTYVEQISEINKDSDIKKKEISDLQKNSDEIKRDVPDKDRHEIEKEINDKENFIKKSTLRLESLKKENSFLKKEFENLAKIKNQIESLSLKKKEEEKNLDNNAKRYDDILKDLDGKENLNEKKSKTDSEISILKSEIKKNSELIDKIESMDKCPLCLQEVTSKHKEKIRSEKEMENSRLNLRLKDLESSLDSLKKEMDKINSLKEEKNKLANSNEWLRKRINDISSEIERNSESLKKENELKNKISENEKEISDLQKMDYDSASKEINFLKEGLKKYFELDKVLAIIDDKIKVYEANKAKVIKLKAKIGKINVEKKEKTESLSAINSDLDSLSGVEEEYDKKEKDLNNTKTAYAVKEREVLLLKKQHENLILEIDRKEKAKLSGERIKNLENWISGPFTSLISGIERATLSRVYYEFNEYFVKWLSLLVDNESITGMLDENFKPVIEHNGYIIETENLSGGEKTSVALAYRLALNKSINNLVDNINTKDLIILDEPTDGFSTEQLDRVRDVLDELNMKQMIIVSHETKMETFVNSIVRIVKDNGVSKVYM